jgi:uncharacterized membrane protein YjjP (DUF1212 family)
MMKFGITFILGMAVGYAYGYQQGETGQPSVVQRIVGSVSGTAYKVKADQERRERVADSVSAPVRR